MLIAFGIQSKRAASELYKERDARRVSTNQRRGVCVYNKKKIRKLFGQKKCARNSPRRRANREGAKIEIGKQK